MKETLRARRNSEEWHYLHAGASLSDDDPL